MIKKYAFVLVAIFCFVFSSFGQVNNGDFESWTGSTPDDWTTIDNGITTSEETTIIHGGSSSASINVTTGTQGSTDLRQTVTLINGHDYTVSVWVRHTEGNMRARFFYNGGYGNYSTNSNTTSWQEITTTFTATSTSEEFGLRFYDQTGFDGAEIVYVDDYTITDNSVPTGPTITAVPTILTGFTYEEGSDPSGEQSFTVEGSNLTDDIDVTAPTNWEISTNSGSGFGGTVSLPETGGTVSSTTIYARMVSGLLNVNSPFNGNITATSTNDGITENISVEGTVTIVGGSNCTELFISEYVEGSSNNKYIEIYNPTGGSINLTNYQLAKYANGSGTPTTLSLSGNLASYSTYIIANSSATIYSGTIDLTNVTVINFNGNDAIALQTSGGVNIDVVGVIGNGSIFGENTTLRRKSTIQNPNTTYSGTEWDSYAEDNVSDLGSHTSDCQGPTPELQLVDNTTTNQNCGYTIDFDSQAIATNTDITFDIENVGSADLDVSSLNITGDYTIISPATAFTVTAGNSQTVTVRFTPTTNGVLTGVLTINNNDSNEGACTINLTGEGYTPGPNIIVRGVVGSLPTTPTIANGSTTTSPLNNTLFAQQTINSTQQTKSFRIGNEGGTAPLTVSNITLTGDTADFFVTESFTNPFAEDTFQDFTITFQPTTASGVRQATVTITNSDSNKNPYTFVVEGTANCPSVSGNIFPTSGPAGTTVTITSPGNDLTGATADLNGVSLTPVSDSTNELIVRLPNTITTGGVLSVNLVSNSCVFSNTFTLIDELISGCEVSAGATVDDLFISEVTDSPYGSMTYVELYNATRTDINFGTTNYSIRVYNNGSPSTYNDITLNSGTILQNGTFVISMGTSGPECAISGGDGSYAQANIGSASASINFKSSGNYNIGHDFIGLYDASSSLLDSWGVFGDETWAAGLGLLGQGAHFERLTSATIPSVAYSNSDWAITNWNDCPDADYSTIGAYDFSTGTAPSISIQPIDPIFACVFSTSLSVTGQEGFDGPSDTQDLEYRWFVNAPGSGTWNEISVSDTNYTGQQSATLNILDTTSLEDYQYYCQVREDNATCYIASDSVRLNRPKSVWDGTNWSFPPASNRIVIINGNYNTNTRPNGETSFSACQLIVNAGNELVIAAGYYVDVENDVSVFGDGSNTDGILVEDKGSFVQRGNGTNAGTYTLHANARTQVNKKTAPLNNWYEYTYWSSPVANETIDGGLNEAHPTRRYWYDGQNFLDETAETNNDNNVVAGQDDIDDDGNDWQFTNNTDIMIPGVGYAAMHNPNGFTIPGVNYEYTFNGSLNTGDYTVPIYRNDAETNDNNWNFIGNPYPSAIDADAFLAANAVIDQSVSDPTGITDGAIYLWSQNTAPSGSTNGNEALNFAQADYAIINGTGETAGGDGVTPNRFIPSGQGLFISYSDAATPDNVNGNIKSGIVSFTNSMRVTENNNQFFRDSNSIQQEKLWLDLTSDNGVFNQILIGYVDGATNEYDGMYFDAPRNLSAGSNTILYTNIPESDKKFAIQGKHPESLSLDEVIPLGFYTSIQQATVFTISIDHIQGDFLTANLLYLKDNFTNSIHNLSETPYNFTSETGEFNNRFEVIFRDSALSVDNYVISNISLSIVELTDNNVKFSVSANNTSIKSVEIIDLLGRTLYTFKGTSKTEVYNVSNLSSAPYIAKVTLSNNQVLVKKAVKK